MWDKKTVITRTIEYHYASLTGRCESSGTRNAIAYLIVYTQRHPEKQNKKDRKIRESLKIKKKKKFVSSKSTDKWRQSCSDKYMYTLAEKHQQSWCWRWSWIVWLKWLNGKRHLTLFPLRISDTPQAGFEPVQNLNLGLVQGHLLSYIFSIFKRGI